MAMIQAVSYNFSTVENPLSDGGAFTAISDVNFSQPLKVISGNLCEPTVTTSACAAGYFASVPAPGNTWPNDQYSELTLTTWSVAGGAFAYLLTRQGAFNSTTQYITTINGAGSTYTFFAVVSGIVHNLKSGAQASAQGDVFRFSIVGNVLTLYRNGTQVQTFTDTNNYIASGVPGFGFQATNVITQTQTSLWAAGANQSATPTFSPVAGSYTGTQIVTITSASGGTIYYTTDGTTPTHASSSIASGSTISVAATETVKAIASATNNLDSAVGSAAYTITPVTPILGAGTGQNVVDAGTSFATQIKSPRTVIIGTNLRTKII